MSKPKVRKPLTSHSLSPTDIITLSVALDQCWELDLEPTFPTNDNSLAGTSMLLTARMLVALRNQLDYFKIPRQPSTDFCVEFRELAEVTVSVKTIERHVNWLISDNSYEQDALFEDTEEWAYLNYKLFIFVVAMIMTMASELDDVFERSNGDKISDHLLPSILIRQVVKPEWLTLPDYGRTKYMLVRRLVKKARVIANTAECPLPV